MRRLLLFLGIFLLAVPSIAFAVQREVGPGQTYETIQACEDAANSGDICNVHAGTYNEQVVIEKANLTLQNNSGDTPIVNAGGGANMCFYNAANSTTIKGFACTNFGTAPVGTRGIHSINGLTGVSIRNNIVHDGYGYGIEVIGGTVTLIDGNTVYNLVNSAGGTAANGIVVQSAASTDA